MHNQGGLIEAEPGEVPLLRNINTRKWLLMLKPGENPTSGVGLHTRRRRITRVLAAGGLALAVALAPLGISTGAVAAEGDSKVRIALTGDIDTLNPFLNVLSTGGAIIDFQYEPLVEWSQEDNTEYPAIAESWEVSDDAMEWTFTLEPDAKWSDGEPIIAEDVIWTIEAIQNNDALKMSNGPLVENIDSLEAPDDLTVVMKMKSPQAPNPGVDLPIVPSHVWAKIDKPEEAKDDKDVVGSGPYTTVESSKTSGVTMKANPNYRHGESKNGGIVFIPYKNMDAAIQALKTSEVDIVDDMTIAQFDSLKGVEGVTTINGLGKAASNIAINPGAKDIEGKPMGDGNPVLQDLVVRQAIVRAIDNETLREKIRQGKAEPGTGVVPPIYSDFHWSESPKDLPLAYDPVAANKLLDDAGYKKGADGIRLDKSGKPIELRILGRSSNATHQQIADYLGPWLEEIGIATNVSMKSDAQVNDDSTLGLYDMFFTGWSVGPDPDFQLSINLCSSRPNADGTGATTESNWCDPEFDKLYAQQHSELDPKKRAETVIEMQKIKYNAAVSNAMYYPDRLQAYRSDRFTNVKLQPAEGGVLVRQNGPWGVYELEPVSGADAAEGGSSATWWIVGGVVAVVVVGGFVIANRRKASADDQE
jgi:peptide/nickel transport system substrate-binding protein